MGNSSTESDLQGQRVENRKPSFMRKALVVTASVLLAVGIMFYVLIANSNRPNHIHFSTRGGVLKNVVYYSANPPETPAQHDCDGQFTEMRDDLYPTHQQLWQEKYGR